MVTIECKRCGIRNGNLEKNVKKEKSGLCYWSCLRCDKKHYLEYPEQLSTKQKTTPTEDSNGN